MDTVIEISFDESSESLDGSEMFECSNGSSVSNVIHISRDSESESCKSPQEIEYYDNDLSLPIYKSVKCGLKTKDSVMFLLSDPPEEVIAKNVPFLINRNVSFIYSVESIGHWKKCPV